VTVPVNATAPVALLLKTLTATFSPGTDVGVADCPRVPLDSLTFTVSAAVHVTLLVVLPMVNVSVALPVAVPPLVSTIDVAV